MTPITWLVIIVFLIIAEIMTSNLTTIWFVGGGIAGFIACLCGLKNLTQWLIFCALSLVLIIVIRPIAKKALKVNPVKTNVDAIIGKKALVTKEINNRLSTGEVSVGGAYWTARTVRDEMILSPGETVIVAAVNGVKLIVLPEDQA